MPIIDDAQSARFKTRIKTIHKNTIAFTNSITLETPFADLVDVLVKAKVGNAQVWITVTKGVISKVDVV